MVGENLSVAFLNLHPMPSGQSFKSKCALFDRETNDTSYLTAPPPSTPALEDVGDLPDVLEEAEALP